MRCPVDKNDMIVVEYHSIELDHCLQCSGVWLDSGEMDLLVDALASVIGEMSPADLITPQTARTTEAHRKCPVCGRKMDKVWIGKEPQVLVDNCPLGDGLWFDGGELHQVLGQMGSEGKTAPDNILGFLGDALQAEMHEGENK